MPREPRWRRDGGGARGRGLPERSAVIVRALSGLVATPLVFKRDRGVRGFKPSPLRWRIEGAFGTPTHAFAASRATGNRAVPQQRAP